MVNMGHSAERETESEASCGKRSYRLCSYEPEHLTDLVRVGFASVDLKKD